MAQTSVFSNGLRHPCSGVLNRRNGNGPIGIRILKLVHARHP